jgi:hypothetical protein
MVQPSEFISNPQSDDGVNAPFPVKYAQILKVLPFGNFLATVRAFVAWA